MNELKPCPFCGGEAIIMQENNWWVACTDCTAEIGFDGMTDTSGCFGHYNTEAEAIEAWNTRAERTCHALPQISDTVCVVKRDGMEIECGYWTCSECRCENFAGAKFCMECGAKMVG